MPPVPHLHDPNLTRTIDIGQMFLKTYKWRLGNRPSKTFLSKPQWKWRQK